jgi:hypothetical protein
MSALHVWTGYQQSLDVMSSFKRRMLFTFSPAYICDLQAIIYGPFMDIVTVIDKGRALVVAADVGRSI